MKIAAALSALALASVAPAEDHEIITDRPDFTESPDAVPENRIQLEAGVLYTRSDDPDADEWELGQPLLRIGFAPGAELRVELPSWAWLDEDGADQDQGLTDASLGLKLEIVQQDGWRPGLAVLGSIGAPVGDEPFTADDIELNATLAWSYDLPNDWSVAGNLGLSSLVDDHDRFVEAAASIALGFPIADRLGSYVEYFGLFRADGGGPPEHVLNGGITYLITPTLQLDAYAGVGLNDNSPDYFIGAGVSVLF